MTLPMTLPMTLTEAQLQSGVLVVLLGLEGTHSSNTRIVPYAELYRALTSILETPVEHIQKAAEDERKRKSF